MSEDAPHYGPIRFLGYVPAGTRMTPHPSGNGVLLAHPDFPLRWVRIEDGKVLDETIVPARVDRIDGEPASIPTRLGDG